MAQVGDGVSFSCCCFLQVPVGLLNWPGDTKVSKTKTVRGSGVTEVSELHIYSISCSLHVCQPRVKRHSTGSVCGGGGIGVGALGDQSSCYN